MTKRERVQQVGRWLRDRYVTPFPVIIRVVNRRELKSEGAGDGVDRVCKNDHGDCCRIKNKIYIRIGGWLSTSEMLHTLIHEYSHAMTVTYPKIEDLRVAMGGHDGIWGLVYSNVYSHFYDKMGHMESRSY